MDKAIRIAHLADIHIGVEAYGKIDERTGLPGRVVDFLACLDQAIDLALDAGVEAVIIAGDIFKSRNPDATHLREFARRVQRLAAANVPVIIVEGNHDVPKSTARASSIEVFRTLDVPNVSVIGRIEALTITTSLGKPLQITGVPWVEPHKFLSDERFAGMNAGQIGDEIVAAIQERLAGIGQALRPEIPSVFSSHASFAGATYGSERMMVWMGRDWILPLDLLKSGPYSYGALGHIHRHQLLGETPPVVYSGSISRIDFGEEHDQKGFVIADVFPEGKAASWRFVPLDARPFVTVKVDLAKEDPEIPTRPVLQAIERSRGKIHGAVVKVEIKLRRGKDQLLNYRAINAALVDAGAYHIANIARLVVDESPRIGGLGDLEQGVAPETLAPLDALGRWLDARSLTPERRAQLLERAQHELADTGIAEHGAHP